MKVGGKTAAALGIGAIAIMGGCGGADDDTSARVEVSAGRSAPHGWCTPGCASQAENTFEQALQSTWTSHGWGTPPAPSAFSLAGQNWVIFTVGPDKAPAFTSLVTTYSTIVPVNSGWYDEPGQNGVPQHWAIVYDPSNPPNYPHSGYSQ